MVKAAEVPVSEPPDVRVAVTVWDVPARIRVIVCELSTPDVKAAVVPLPAENKDVDVMSTVPVKFVTVRLPESCAVIITLKEVPAVWLPSAEPLVVVTANLANSPYAVIVEDAEDCVPDPFALIAVTLNAYVLPAVRPVAVQVVEVDVGALDWHVPALTAA